jgi:4-amino-4-deoxy-L-arabinose transferase-like glycosyltransferase
VVGTRRHAIVEESTPVKNHRRLLVYGLLLALFAQVALAARHTSITLDEPLHITSGYACLVTGDYRLVEEHPPLLKMLQALPLLFARPRLPDPRTVPGWQSGDLITAAQHVVVPYRPIEPLVYAARVPTMLVGLLLAVLVYRWAADAFDTRAGLMALVLYVFDPNMLAHAGVAATDLGAACAMFAAMYAFWRWARKTSGPSWGRCLVAAVALGLALGVKTTALMLLPVCGFLLLLARPTGRSLKPYLLQVLVGGAVAFLVLWALYRFEVGPVPGLPVPVPAPSHLLPLFKLQEHMSEGHSAFLMGENYHHGVWTYFPIAFALKTPPLTLALLLLTLIGVVLRRVPSPGWRAEVILLALPLLYFGLSLTSGINIGYRHLLPILPFLFVWISRLTPHAPHITHHASRITFHVLRFTFYVFLASYAIISLTLFPWHLAYFNLFAGGPDGGYRYLVDSNLDWGQTWKALRRYLDERGVVEFGLSQYTINDPRAYGLDYIPLPPWPDAPPVLPRRFDPAPGVYAISTTTLQGVVVADSEMFDYFRKLEPAARVGHAMFVYEVEPHPPADWVAQCTVPVVPLPPDVLVEGLGQDDLRLAEFDCSQSWLYPAAASGDSTASNGWYVLSRDYRDWGLAHVERARLAYEQTRPGFVPPFAVYEWFGQKPLEGVTAEPVYAAPSDWPPQQVQAEGTPLHPPVLVGDVLEFLGYVSTERMATPDSRTMTIETYWHVVRAPAESLSLMGHLLGDDGVPVAVSDGLGVPITHLQTGDIVVQRHVFELPPESVPDTYWLQVGAYTLPDVQRLPALQHGTTVGDRLLVGQIELIGD